MYIIFFLCAACARRCRFVASIVSRFDVYWDRDAHKVYISPSFLTVFIASIFGLEMLYWAAHYRILDGAHRIWQ